jgi:hypothetical protein
MQRKAFSIFRHDCQAFYPVQHFPQNEHYTVPKVMDNFIVNNEMMKAFIRFWGSVSDKGHSNMKRLMNFALPVFDWRMLRT